MHLGTTSTHLRPSPPHSIPKSCSHSTHHVLALYTLGASPEIIEDAYETAHDYLLPVIKTPGPITEKNFAEHLADER